MTRIDMQLLEKKAEDGHPGAIKALAEYRRSVGAEPPPKKGRAKGRYGIQPVRLDNQVFGSKWEAEVYQNLKILAGLGELEFFTHVTASLPSTNTLNIDFIVFREDKLWVIDAKGLETRDWKCRRREYETDTGRKIYMMRRGDLFPWLLPCPE